PPPPAATRDGGRAPARSPPAPPPSTLRRVRSKVGRAARRVGTPAVATTGAGPSPMREPRPDDDAYDGVCNVCGEAQRFERRNASLREGYRCTTCKASLRYRGQAD